MQPSLQPDSAQVQALLPESVQQIAGLIGFPATEALIRHFGGVSFRIGKGLRGTGGATHCPAAGRSDPDASGLANEPFWQRGAVYSPL